MSTSLPRREALKGLLATALTTGISLPSAAAVRPVADPKPFSIHIFSKHLQFLTYEELASAAADLGFDGVDLTVRPGGHVEPELVRQMLPRAVEAMQKKSLLALMMTTAVTDASHSLTKPILETAGQQGIKLYRTGWLPYPAEQPVPAVQWQYQQQLTELARLNERYGLAGAYQNHAGGNFGAGVWDLYQVLQAVRSPFMGCQYDIRHATVEGGMSWPSALRAMLPHIRFLGIKDFVWEKRNGRWQVVNVPLGQGMVDFPALFKTLNQAGLRVPISLHLEYPLGGADQGSRTLTIPRQQVYKAMETDLATLRRYLEAV